MHLSNEKTCSGVIEFIGIQENVGEEIIYKPKFEEKKNKESSTPLFLVYKCSKCNDITVKANDGFNLHLKKAKMYYHKHQTTKPILMFK